MNDKVYIYALCEADTGEVRYIGKANNVEKRFGYHLRDRASRKTPVYNWMNKRIRDGKIPSIHTVAVTTQKHWKEIETMVIAQYAQSGNLLNVAAGGDQPHCSKEQRATNGRNNARAIHDDPFKKHIWKLKQMVALDMEFLKGRKDQYDWIAESYNKNVDKLRYAAAINPSMFGEYAKLEYI